MAERETTSASDASTRPYRMAWCPVCRERVGITAQWSAPSGHVAAWDVFDAHGCPHEGQKVRDPDHGFITGDGRTVSQWEFHDPTYNAPSGQVPS